MPKKSVYPTFHHSKLTSHKQKKNTETITSRLAVVMKSGKFTIGYKSTVNALRNGKGCDSVALSLFFFPTSHLSSFPAQLVIIANNAPALRKSELEYYAMLAKCYIHHFTGNAIDLGSACGKLHLVSAIAITDPGDSDIIKAMESAQQAAAAKA